MYVQANIGRAFHTHGYGRVEMSHSDWTRFMQEVEVAIARFANAMRDVSDSIKNVELHEGVGGWSDGNLETSAHISIYFDGHTRIDSLVEGYIRDLELSLKDIAGQFYQEAIALIIAGSYTNNGDRATLIYAR